MSESLRDAVGVGTWMSPYVSPIVPVYATSKVLHRRNVVKWKYGGHGHREYKRKKFCSLIRLIWKPLPGTMCPGCRYCNV